MCYTTTRVQTEGQNDFLAQAFQEHRERLYRFLESDAGQRALATSAHGVAARFLSKQNVLEIEF